MTETKEAVSIAIPLAVLTVVTLIAGNTLFSGLRKYDSEIEKGRSK